MNDIVPSILNQLSLDKVPIRSDTEIAIFSVVLSVPHNLNRKNTPLSVFNKFKELGIPVEWDNANIISKKGTIKFLHDNETDSTRVCWSSI